ncbi:MAG: sigma-54 dependent transcriptional regulator [Planctomycetota bacterium]
MTSADAEPAKEANLEGFTILVVDDEDDVRRGLQKLIGSLQAEVLTAPDGARALSIVRDGGIDIVVSDIRMPHVSGIELLDAVRKESPKTEVLMMTGFGTIELAVSCMAAGAAHFVAKPFDNRQVLRVLLSMGRRIRANAESRPERQTSFVVADAKMVAVMAHIDQVASTKLPVLIEGETGTGKELVAREIHRRSGLAARPFLAVNCAALPDTLLESELFGHRSGAFTGAERDRVGLFASAQGGTVFLDEIASMSPAFQGKLLRVLQNQAVRPLGADKDVPVEFRLLAATNRNLEKQVRDGKFRDDLLYRLRILHVEIPPLRERPGDISAIARSIVERSTADCRGVGAKPPVITADADRLLREQPWPGNVRELEAVVIRALVASRGDELDAHHLDLKPSDSSKLSYDAGKKRAIASFQRRFVEDALSVNKGNISHAADACGLTRAALQKIIRSLQIDRARFVSE